MELKEDLRSIRDYALHLAKDRDAWKFCTFSGMRAKTAPKCKKNVWTNPELLER